MMVAVSLEEQSRWTTRLQFICKYFLPGETTLFFLSYGVQYYCLVLLFTSIETTIGPLP